MFFRLLTKEEEMIISASKALHYEAMKEMLMVISFSMVILITILFYEDIIRILYKNNLLHINDYINMTSEEYRRKKEYEYFYSVIIKEDLHGRKVSNPGYHIYWSNEDYCFNYINKETGRKESYKIDHYPEEYIVYAEAVLEGEVSFPSAPILIE